jgi:hypothetical protein
MNLVASVLHPSDVLWNGVWKSIFKTLKVGTLYIGYNGPVWYLFSFVFSNHDFFQIFKMELKTGFEVVFEKKKKSCLAPIFKSNFET